MLTVIMPHQKQYTNLSKLFYGSYGQQRENLPDRLHFNMEIIIDFNNCKWWAFEQIIESTFKHTALLKEKE